MIQKSVHSLTHYKDIYWYNMVYPINQPEVSFALSCDAPTFSVPVPVDTALNQEGEIYSKNDLQARHGRDQEAVLAEPNYSHQLLPGSICPST